MISNEQFDLTKNTSNVHTLFMALFSAHCASYYPWPPETKNFSKQDGKNNSLSLSVWGV